MAVWLEPPPLHPLRTPWWGRAEAAAPLPVKGKQHRSRRPPACLLRPACADERCPLVPPAAALQSILAMELLLQILIVQVGAGTGRRSAALARAARARGSPAGWRRCQREGDPAAGPGLPGLPGTAGIRVPAWLAPPLLCCLGAPPPCTRADGGPAPPRAAPLACPQFGGEWFHTHPLDAREWAVCVGLGATTLGLREILRRLPYGR